MGVRATFRTPQATLGGRRFGLLGCRFDLAGGLLCVAAHHLFDAHWKRTPFLDTDQRQGEKGQPWHGLAVQARKETIQAMRTLAGFGHDDFIASGQIDIIRAVDMLTEEHPKQDRPGNDRGEKALDGTIAPAFAGPAGDSQHRDPSCHHQQSQSNPAQLAPGRRWQRGSQALQECYNVHCGLLRRRGVEVVVDYHSNATTEALSS